MHPAAELQLFFVEADEVVAGGVLHGVVILEISLQHNFAGSLAAPGASGHLRQQLKRALGGAKVRQAERHVGPDHADQRHAVNVVALGDHLRADEQVEFALIQGVQRALEIFVAADGVAIEAGDARLGKHAVQQLFQLFRARSEKINILAAAVDARFRDGRSEAAIVADHFVLALVMGERDGAVLAFEFLAASAAQDDGRISAAVEQHHDLLFAVEALSDFGRQLARDDLLVAGFLELLAHVDDFDFGQRTLLDAVGQFDQRILVLSSR